MRKCRFFTAIAALSGLASLLAVLAVEGRASALTKRVEVVQQGDFALIGAPLAQDCGPVTPAPVTGTADCTGAGNVLDLTPDIYWLVEGGAAMANASVAGETAQTAARLTLPEGAVVTHAYLYWAGLSPGAPDNSATLLCLDAGGSPTDVQAVGGLTSFNGTFGAVGNVTQYVQMNGACTYLVGGVTGIPLSSQQGQPYGYAGWWMVVFYTAPGAPHRLLTLHDGLDTVGNGIDTEIKLSGFMVPKDFSKYSNAKLGVAAFDGDALLLGDQLLVNQVAVEDAPGNTNNFFNGTRSFFGAPVSSAEDLPQLSGGPGSLSRMDLDVVDISPLLSEGQVELSVLATSGGEPFDLTGIVASIPAFTDKDGDSIGDDEEMVIGTRPDDADSDDDGVPDNQEGCSSLANCSAPDYAGDADKDGVINALDPDSDGDGLFDGTELGLDCSAKDTKKAAARCIADADMGQTVTDPLAADTDGGGVKDGSEDINRNGAIDAGETNPTTGNGGDDASIPDGDNDGLSDGLEQNIGSDPADADTDDDGLMDGEEVDAAVDTDGDGLPNVRDVDSDNDVLYDGTEAGKGCEGMGTNGQAGHCIADADPNTRSSPVAWDSDGGGASDGSEDGNRNGAIDSGETDSENADDDASVADTDTDGLSDALEIALNTSTNDQDSDEDGLLDGKEDNPGDDNDGDGMIDLLDVDSDNDGLKDGTERGFNCMDPATDKTKKLCVPDGDKGGTKTSMLIADTDGGGVIDGKEDLDKDGVFDPTQGEGDPNDASDDMSLCVCESDADCGEPDSGLVCDSVLCTCWEGCRGTGNGCPDGLVCSSTDDSVGKCEPQGDPGSGGAGPGSGGGGGTGGAKDTGCSCGVVGANDGSALPLLLMAAGAAAATRRRRRPAR